MHSVISATTGKTYGTGAAVSRGEQFLDTAEALLAQAHGDFEEGSYDLAMENAYRAALRVAGAWCSRSPALRKRKRLPTSAWDKLALTGEEGAAWAKRFAAYSAQRGRVASGIETNPGAAVVLELIGHAEAFLFEARPEAGALAA